MRRKLVVLGLCFVMLITSMTGCGIVDSKLNDIKGSLVGNEYLATFYTNAGSAYMTMSGEKISLASNQVKVEDTSDDGWHYEMSSVVTVNIDGNELENCGSTIIFAEKGLEPDVSFEISDIESSASGLGDNTAVSGVVNKYKNKFGKARVVIIQSQLGVPICAYSGKDVYYEVCDDLPKTTKLMVDGKALYIHRANFQIVDKALLDN